MKKTLLLLFAAASLIWVACNNKGGDNTTGNREKAASDTVPNSPCALSATDFKFINGWNNYRSDAGKLHFSSEKDVPVPDSIADKCINEYKRRFGGTTPDVRDVKFTQQVLFMTDAFKKWITDYQIFDRSEALVMEFGIYTREVYDDLQNDGNPETSIGEDAINKITVFVSPYTSGHRSTAADGTTVINPFNLGSLHP